MPSDNALQCKFVLRFSEEQHMKIEEFQYSGLLLKMSFIVLYTHTV